jgi:hypothetical protein
MSTAAAASASAAAHPPDYSLLLNLVIGSLCERIPGIFAGLGWDSLIPANASIVELSEDIKRALRWNFFAQYSIRVSVSYESLRQRFHIRYYDTSRRLIVRLVTTKNGTSSVRNVGQVDVAKPCALELFSECILGFPQILNDLIESKVTKSGDVNYLAVAREIAS